MGLNSQLNSVDSLAAKEDKFISGNEFDANYDSGIITTPRLGSAVVGSAQIGLGEVHTQNLADAAVITSKFGTNSVDSTILQDLAVTADKIAANIVAGTHIMGSTIEGTNIAAAAIGSAEIGLAAIGAAAIQNAAIGSAAIGTAAIQSVHLGTAIISDANVGTMTFNTISGGTANLGGTLNGNGLLQVKSQSGGTVIKLNSEGQEIIGRSLTFITGGTDNKIASIYQGAGVTPTLQIENLSSDIFIESDEGQIGMAAGEGTIKIIFGGTSHSGIVRFIEGGANGTVAELDANGNLNIAGALGTGQSF